MGFYETLSLTANFIIIIILCWGGYRVFTPRRNNVSHGDSRLISQRLFWQIVFPATLFLILFPVCCVCWITGEQRKSGRRHAL
ncbi:MASE1 domain-containing protein [Escherichia coli]|nr:MASE1 domain-containing protein [Escherichia coli]